MQGDESAITGDAAALIELLEAECLKLRPRLSARIPRSLRSLLDADDVLQQSCVDVLCSVDGARPTDGRFFSAWFCTIVNRNLIDAVRALRTRKRGGDHRLIPVADFEQSLSALFSQLFARSLTASRQVIAAEALARLQQALRRLPEHYRLVVQHYDLEEEPIERVAQRLGRSIGAVFMIRSRAHQMLAAMLGSSSG
jgi:RNA polymerase sigma factor (sigma-70 family)